MAHNSYTVEIIQKAGLLSSSAAEAALLQAEKEQLDIIQAITQQGCSQTEIFQALAHESGMEFISIATLDLSETAQDIPAEIALRYHIVGIRRTNNTLLVATSDPLDIETTDTLRYILKHTLEFAVALPEEIESAVQQLYGTPSPAEPSKPTPAQHVESENDEPIIHLVNQLIIEGFHQRASDIHLEPLNRNFRVRYRIDGTLREIKGPPRNLHPSVISRIKIMADMKISEKRLPQDGRIEIDTGNRKLDLRVSAIPTTHGESIVLRLLDKESLSLGLPNLGFCANDQAAFERLIRYPDGLNLITGPTGSGKTTTLYACLNHLNQPDRKIITVEDPVEYQISGINQVHVRPDIHLTFAEVLRSILRQAPNIIMIGEIRDRETAEIAVNAALTGHLVLSTLHTNDAPSAITRLADIGVKPFLASSALRGIMAQRLARTICPTCKTTYTPEPTELQLLGSQIHTLSRGEGCSACGKTGYLGRKGLFEIMPINDEIRQLIHAGSPTPELRAKARNLGMKTLREDGLRKVANGTTTLSEILRVTMKDEN